MPKVLLALILSLAFFAPACSESSFTGGGSAKKKSSAPQDAAQNPKDGLEADATKDSGDEDLLGDGQNIIRESFPLQSTTRELDLVWVIDNSGSMNLEAAQVRDNFTRFMTTVSEKANLKIALISSSTDQNYVTLDQTAINQGHVQIDAEVASTDALVLASAATCPQDQTQGDKICNKKVSELSSAPNIGGINVGELLSPSLALVKGQLSGFYRPQAAKVFVIVSDDNAQIVDSNNFIDMVRPHVGEPSVFGFVAIKEDANDGTTTTVEKDENGNVINKQTTTTSGNGCVAAIGTHYLELASQTGGEVYDICETDWQEHFAKLSKDVNTIVQSQFILKTTSVAIEEVLMDGVPLTKDQYTFDGQKITLVPGVVGPSNQTLEVVARTS